ncbi:MAG: Rieske 2Fe-2S domain-containing protein [Actinomycetota bacterium]|nr:Rieske 2Fe-2S domain-containing protein [Actinomycetota bacterium]MDH5225703.1 Rieske 2Fe-2S domain-containing protein [Actinomycetota bacterium]MDH5312748.1 Rieske 2Fe-2S domain-containing protein [Actinomycetota bacterium]
MKRDERVVAAALGVSILAALTLFVVYVRGGNPQAEGALLALALGGVGIGLLVWAKRLMPHIRDETQPRSKTAPATEADREAAVETMESGVEEIRRRRFLSRMLIGAAGALGLAALIPIRSLGRSPGDSLVHTKWTPGARLVTAEGTPVTESTLETGSFTTVFPEGFEGSADSQAVLIRVEPDQLQLPPDRIAGAPDGLVAYSKICTHAGCPLGLYLAATHELRCPCHQSTFDVLDGARPVYGPAPKPLPQLPIEIADDGSLRALGDFSDPVGPGFWEQA